MGADICLDRLNLEGSTNVGQSTRAKLQRLWVVCMPWEYRRRCQILTREKPGRPHRIPTCKRQVV